jgi:hypothetical protein
MCPVLEAGDHRAHHRSLDAADHQAREEAGSLETVGEVVSVEGDDAAHSDAEVDGRRQRKRRAHGLTGQREVGEAEVLDHPNDRCSQGRFLITGAGDDVRPAHPREVERVDRERVGELRNDELEVVQLRAHRVQQDQGWAASDAQVADARSAAQHDVADLPVFAPRLRVCVLRVVNLARPVQVAAFACRGHLTAPGFKDRSRGDVVAEMGRSPRRRRR